MFHYKYKKILYFLVTSLVFTSCVKETLPTKKDIVLPSTIRDKGEDNNNQDKIISYNKAVFTDPAKIKAVQYSYQIMNELIFLLNNSPEGSTVYINIYLIDYNPLIVAISNAHRRGVNINMIVDRSREDSQITNVNALKLLSPVLTGHSKLVIITSDAGSSSINHHKHALFSKVVTPAGTATNVVFSTSHNFTTSDSRKIQDAVIISNDELYGVLVDNWNDMEARAQSGMSGFTFKNISLTSLPVTVQLYPRRINSAWDGVDSYIEFLNKISDYSNSSVTIGMSDWVASRVNVAEKLTALRKLGVKVTVVAKNKMDPEIDAELDKLKTAGGDVVILDMDKGHNIHSKILMIEGTYDGVPNQKILVNGTHNMTTNALKNNNELSLVFKNDNLFDVYKTYMKTVYDTFK